MEIVRKTIEKDLDYLRQRSKEVSFDDPELKDNINTLKDYCLETECFALAAVQVGIPKRILYLKNTSLDVSITNMDYNEGKVLINPVIVSRKGKTTFWESCLSCLDNMGLVVRPYEMVIRYQDVEGNEHEETLEGFPSTVVSHEMDHLEGILHMDIAEKVIQMPRDERFKFRESHPYEIISKTCKYETPKELKK